MGGGLTSVLACAILNAKIYIRESIMTFYDEFYFEITFSGRKAELDRVVAFLKGGGLDDFFEMDNDFIDYDDDYHETPDEGESSFSFSNDEYGIEIDELDADEFLEVLCRAAKKVDLRGELYDVDEEEYRFVSVEGDSYYLNARNIDLFNDELDTQAKEEARDEDEDED